MYELLFCGTNMRNPLDLNNLPDDHQFIRGYSKQPLVDDSSSAASGIYGEMKNNAKGHERGKVYECRFCSLKFRKSQALGGHMNRHRQEREAESLNQARQLVFGTDNMLTPPTHQLRCSKYSGQLAVHGGYHYATNINMGRTIYPTRLISSSSTTILPPPLPPTPPPPSPHQHTYTSQTSLPFNADLSQYSNSQLINDYFEDRYVSSNIKPQFSFHSSKILAKGSPIYPGTIN